MNFVLFKDKTSRKKLRNYIDVREFCKKLIVHVREETKKWRK